MWKLYRINQIKQLSLIRIYRENTSPVEEKVLSMLAIKVGSLSIYQDVFYKECHYSTMPTLVGFQEFLKIDQLSGIETFCTSLELFFGRISKSRLVEIYNQINLPEYRITMKQLELRNKNLKKYGDI